MDITKMLSGDQLVAKGVTKIDASLPEIGMKDVLPNGSWLEQKQIQSALEARKHLIEVERIEKCGVLSHAEWRDDLELAEVTQQTGGYWQYYGCHIGKKLYLKPEEALFLMEVNSLLLKHNGITVSLQKAYSLLLSGTVSVLQYKVYASLSRLGYKVYTYKGSRTDKKKKESISHIIEQKSDNCNKVAGNIDNDKCDIELNKDSKLKVDILTNNQQSLERNELKFESVTKDKKAKTTLSGNVNGEVKELINDNIMSNNVISMTAEETQFNNVKENLNLETVNTNINLNTSPSKQEDKSEIDNQNETESDDKINDISTTDDLPIIDVDSVHKQEESLEIMEISQGSESPVDTQHNSNVERCTTNNEILLQTLLNRKIKPSNSQNIHQYFKDIPDLFQKHTITINVPKEELIPKNIFVNNTLYVLNLQRIQTKNIKTTSNEQTYNASDEVNESLRRIRSSSRNDASQFNPNHFFFANMRYPRMNQQFRPYNFWRPRNNLNYFQFNMFYQRPFLQNCFMPRFAFAHRMNNFLRQFPNSGHFNSNSLGITPTRKRTRDEKQYHLEHIKNLASRFKQIILMGSNRNTFSIQPLQRLISTYNSKFRCRLRLTDDFEIVDDSTILEIIELEEEEDESKKKKPKLDMDTFKDNLDKIRKMALQLKSIEEREIATPRLRRAFYNAIKEFNKSYNADIYLHANYEVIDRRHISLDSSSDSDCVVKESEKKKSKKLRNPFSVLRTLAKTVKPEQPSTSNTYNVFNRNEDKSISDQKNNNEDNQKAFEENWFPNADDFGRKEVVTKDEMNTRIMETYKDELLYEFIQNNPKKYDSWLTAKIAFAKYIEYTKRQLENDHGSIENLMSTNEGRLGPIIGPEDCTDMPSVLDKLRIIATDKGEFSDTSLKIDFDVYNRDVQNFRKSNRPKPHFRVICMNESSHFPTGEDLLGLQSKYKDEVAVVFAIVSISSISYLQINPTDLPLYIPCRDLTSLSLQTECAHAHARVTTDLAAVVWR